MKEMDSKLTRSSGGVKPHRSSFDSNTAHSICAQGLGLVWTASPYRDGSNPPWQFITACVHCGLVQMVSTRDFDSRGAGSIPTAAISRSSNGEGSGLLSHRCGFNSCTGYFASFVQENRTAAS